MKWIRILGAGVLFSACLARGAAGADQGLAERLAEAQALEKAGKTEEALAAYKVLALSDLEGNDAFFRTSLAGARLILLGAGRLDELEEFLAALRVKRPGDGLVVCFVADLSEKRGKIAEAKALFESVARGEGPYTMWAWLQKGRIIVYKEKQPSMEAAEAYLNFLRAAAAARDKLDPGMRHEVTQAVNLLNNYIVPTLNTSLRRFDDAHRIWLAMGDVEGLDGAVRGKSLLYAGMQDYQRGNFELAIRLVGRAVSLQPGDPELVNNLGLIHLAAGEGAKALEHFRNSLELDPRYPDALENLAVYFLKRDQPEKAREYFLEGYAVACERHPLSLRAVEEARKAGRTADMPLLELAEKKERYRLFRFQTYLTRLAKQGEEKD